MTITPLTPESLRAAARAAAENHQTRAEANHYEPGTDLWHMFNDEFRKAEHELHSERRTKGAITIENREQSAASLAKSRRISKAA